MKHDDDRLPLEALRTPVPLRDADYAAIRARVLSELAERKRRKHGWWWAFATAAMLVLWRSAGVPPAPVVEPRRGAPVPVTVERRPLPPLPPPVPATAPAPQVPQVATVRQPERPPLPRGDAPRKAVAKKSEEPKQEPEMRIHLQTEDPDVRIIWIVNATPPTTDKERS